MKDLTNHAHQTDIAVHTAPAQTEWFKTIVRTADEGVWLVNREGITLYVNDAMTVFLGYSPYEILHQYIYEFCAAEDGLLLRTQLHNTFEGNTQKFTLRFRKKNKETVSLQLHIRPFRRENGLVTGIIGTLNYMSKQQINQKHEPCPECAHLNKQKDDFITMASHELKTPLTSIKAFTQILQHNSVGDTSASAVYLRKIENQTNRLMKLINELLDVSKIRSGRFTIMKEWFYLDELINDVVSEFPMRYPSHALRKTGSTDKRIFADPDRIRQMILILIHNAVKYSPHKDAVEIDLSVKKDSVRIDIKDYGIGITEEDQRRLFQPFFRVVDTEEKEVPGLGIGLYLSAEIVHAHQGSIQVTSAKGVGSTFSCILPIQSTL